MHRYLSCLKFVLSAKHVSYLQLKIYIPYTVVNVNLQYLY
jgi:hypothetical protein